MMHNLQFFGLPSVGKTTLMSHLVENFPDKYIIPKIYVSSSSELKANWRMLFSCLFDIKLLTFLLLVFLSSIANGTSFKFTFETMRGVLFNIVNFKLNQRAVVGTKLILWDEMLSQRVYSSLAYGKKMRKFSLISLRLMLYISGRYCFAIHLTAEEDFIKRIEKRGLTDRMKRMTSSELSIVLKLHKQLDDFILNQNVVDLSVDSNPEYISSFFSNLNK